MKAKLVNDILLEKTRTTPMIRKTKLKLSKKQNKKVSDNELDNLSINYTKESINEAIKINGHIYNLIKYQGQLIYISNEGILGKNDVFIPWDLIKKIKK